MKRFLIFIVAVMIGVFVVSLQTAFAQGPVPTGFPPQAGMYEDAVLLARLLPLIAALGIGFGIWQGKTTMREPKSAPNVSTVIRHDWGTVIAHWTNGIGFIIGMMTGMIVLRVLPRPDEMRIIFAIHYVGSGLVMFGFASHLAQNLVTGGMGLIPRSLRDVRDGISDLMEQAGLYGSSGAVFGIGWPKAIRDTLAETAAAFGFRKPKNLGKYLPAEKVFSYTPWAIIVITILVTGVIKSLRYLYPIPPDFIATVSTIHDIFAYAAIVMLGIHLVAVLLVPRHWPLLISMLTTRISRDFVQKFHPLWYQDLVKKESSATTTAPTPQATTQTVKET